MRHCGINGVLLLFGMPVALSVVTFVLWASSLSFRR